MRCSAPSLRSLSAATTFSAVETMSFAPRYRDGGRSRWQRNFSNQCDGAGKGHSPAGGNSTFREGEGGDSQPPPHNGRGPYNQSFHPPSHYNHNQQYPQTEPRFSSSRGRPYSHNQPFQSRQTSQPYYPNQQFAPPQQYNQNPTTYRPSLNFPNPHFLQQPLPNPNQPFYRPPPYDQTPAVGRSQQSRPRPPPALNYRNWEYAVTKTPLDCKQFVVLSYNILADYLALDHRSKLYYHIPHYMLDWDWRKRNIIFELKLWSADIMCFQEVDRFQDLEDELKLNGYCGIWKMRTGIPVDGCAIFWRTSRFKLLHEEFIEFNEFGLRDNVAQICVLELLNENSLDNAGGKSIRSTGSSKIVVCNIHVLYNPKRGEIKLGQIRILLDSANSVSKSWDNAPVVLCGDFNCTPKSPLYNFISEQKLNLSRVDRDKLSGQASAEIHGTRSNFCNNRELPTDKSIQHRSEKESSVEHKHNSASVDDVLCENNLSPYKSCSSELVQDSPDYKVRGHDATKCDIQIAGNVNLDESSAVGEQGLLEDIYAIDTTKEKFSEDCFTLAEESTDLRSTVIEPQDIDISISVTATDLSFKEESAAVTYPLLDENLRILSLDEVDESTVEGDQSPSEDGATFLAALHEGEESLQLESPSGLEPEPGTEETTPYDPSKWTSTDIATATGSEDTIILEHKLKLRSTYTEVEDVSKTRDDDGEPLVTSYHRRFMGTVDYIWRSEGLQTVRVLAPIPKEAMQWTPGFPTKKWGSDHIALVSELALTGNIASEVESSNQ